MLHQSYGEGEQFALDSSFFGVLADILVEGLLSVPVEQIACLALSKLGHRVPEIRQRAFQLVQSLQSDQSARMESSALLPLIGSTSPLVYQDAQSEMARRIAPLFADHAVAFLAECTTRLSQLDAPRREATLNILPPWMSEIDLSSAVDASQEELVLENQALMNLMYISVRFSDDHLLLLKDIIHNFAGTADRRNRTALIRFLFEQGGKRKSPDFVVRAQQIIAFLATCPAGSALFEEIASLIEPSAMAARPEVDVPPSAASSLVNLDSLMTTSRPETYSTGQLALLFAGELLPFQKVGMDLESFLPTLLHAAIIHSDHASSLVRISAQSLIFQVLRMWICEAGAIPAADAAAFRDVAESKLTTLARSASTVFWRLDDVNDDAFFAPRSLTSFVLKIIGIVLPTQPSLRQIWGELALAWATSCPIRHFACRSFQVFRILMPRVSPKMVADTLARLSSTIASASPEIQTFNQEVLRSFASIVQALSTADFANYPQIFWCTIACLTTPFEDEFSEVIDVLSHVLDKTNLADQSVVQHLLSYQPPEWVGPAPHIQASLLIGLRSSKTAFMAFDLIRRLSSAPYDDLIDSRSDRLIHGYVSALLWMLQSADVGEPNQELASMAEDLAALADQQNNTGLSRLLTSFARARFRSKDDFVRQAAGLLRENMATHALTILTLLLGFSLNANDWMREKSMQVLKLILQAPEAKVVLGGYGNELLQPLLRLVATKHAAQALDTLDMPNDITGAINHHASTNGEIFGPIAETGWSVPKAKEMSALTRENVTAVFNTCAVETRAASAHFSVVQFADVRSFAPNPSQVSLDLPSPTSANDNASMGDLVGALHSLNQFFDDSSDGLGGMFSPNTVDRSGFAGHGRMASESGSERRVRAIMAVSISKQPKEGD